MRVLVAVDGSSVSDETLEYAIDIADALEADVTVCHVVERSTVPVTVVR